MSAAGRTVQDAFDVMAVHLLTQMQHSQKRHSCAYRGDGGLKCAVGALIPDEMYDPKMEGCSADGSTVLFGLKAAGWIDTDPYMYQVIRRFQTIHDRRAIPLWETHIREVAARFDLSTDAIDALPTGAR